MSGIFLKKMVPPIGDFEDALLKQRRVEQGALQHGQEKILITSKIKQQPIGRVNTNDIL